LNGVRTVLRRDNVVEALSICEATPGPVANLVKTAIKHREKGREAVRDLLDETGRNEVPRLEERLSVLATVAQIAPLIGLLGAVLSLIGIMGVMRGQGMAIHPYDFAQHIYGGLCSTALGLAVAILNFSAYNYLLRRVDAIIHDMERAADEALNMLWEK
jgi:biopolymer transport protein ExbB